MDRFETASNCSETSVNSECVSSNISNLSSLSEYQDEFLELKQLINQDVLNETTKSGCVTGNVIQYYERQIVKIKAQLQNSIKENERYKKDICSLEKKKDLQHSAKIDQLLKQNKHLEDNLLAANNQIRRLIDICHKKEDFDANIVLLEERNLELEKVNNELTNQVYLLSNKINHCSFQKNEIEHECKSFKSELNDLKLEIAAKTECVCELKRKLSEQHVHLNGINQTKVKLSHSLELVSNELQHVKKSEDWYKTELQRIQQEKNCLTEKILKNERVIALQEEEIEHLHLELNNLKCAFDGIRLIALKEKEEMCKHVEEKRITKDNNGSVDFRDNIENISSHYEGVVNDLRNDVRKIKVDFDQQQKHLEDVSREKSEIFGKYLSLQSTLSEKNNTIETMENNVKFLKTNLVVARNVQEKQNLELLELKKDCAKLELELNLKNKETEVFEGTAVTIKEQCKLLSSRYLELKNELKLRNQEILRLQYEMQELSVDNNRKISELKRSMQEDALEIKKLNQRIVFLEGVEADLNLENRNHVETITNLNAELLKLQTHLKSPSNKQSDFVLAHENFENNHVISQVDGLSVEKMVEEPSSLKISANLIDALKYICKQCKLNEGCRMGSEEDFIKLVLHKIETYHRLDSRVTPKHRKKLGTCKRNILVKILHLVERCRLLEKKAERTVEMLRLNTVHCSNNKNVVNKEIQRLQVQLEVNAQEGKEKQKRYERNYRTLLRKVKEHMSGRRLAEKRNDYLQELNNTLSSTCNSLKLELDLKQSEIKEVHLRLQRCSSTNDKLKSTVLKNEKELADFTFACKCVDLGKRITELEKALKACENDKNAVATELKFKEEQLNILQKEHERLLKENSSNSAKIELEQKLQEMQRCNEELRQEIGVMKDSVCRTRDDNVRLTSELNHVASKSVQLQQEVERLNSCLQRKFEEVQEFKLRKEQAKRRWSETETNMQNLVTSLKSQIYTFQAEIHLLKNGKFFLQRLCNDLNVALKTYISQNKSLKEYVGRLCKQQEWIASDTDILSHFPSPVKCDDSYIEKLLQENSMPGEDKPYCDIQECINTLKTEIVCLQKQIAEKNVPY